MLHIPTKQHFAPARTAVVAAMVLGIFVSLLLPTTLPANAQVYNGGGIQKGVDTAAGIAGVSTQTNLRDIIINAVKVVLRFLALVAVIVIIIAAIILITSQGDETKKDTCKKAILYALVGLVIILLSEAVVNLFITDIPNAGIIGETGDIVGNKDIRSTVLDILYAVLRFMALVAVIVIIIAGIRLVISQGEETEKDKAKKAIFYAIIGLIIILLAEAMVRIVVDLAN